METPTQETTTLQKTPTESAFGLTTFDHAQRVALMLSKSSLIPKDYLGNVPNTMIALEMANRIGASPLMVMQNLYIVHGKPSWSSTFIIAALNSSKKFSPVRFELGGDVEEYGCYAWAYDATNNEKLLGPKITMKMAKLEGWVDKNGSKWKTMPELMLRYRAAAFFGRLYAPEIMMGMQTMEEVIDVVASPIEEEITVEQLKALYDSSLPELSKPEMDSAKRIIDNNETASFKKLLTLLTSKQPQQ